MPDHRVQSFFNMIHEIAKAYNIDCYNGEPKDSGIFADGRVVLRTSSPASGRGNENLNEKANLEKINELLGSVGIIGYLHEYREGAIIKGYYLLVDQHQENSKNLTDLYEHHVNVADKVADLVKKGILLNENGKASDDPEQAAKIIANTMKKLQTLAEEMGVGNQVKLQLQPSFRLETGFLHKK